MERYSRQILFPGIGLAGQQKLLDARIAIAGCGALGSFQAGALARAGVGHLRVIDRDYVELSNLQRQWLFTEEDAANAMPKAMAAARAISRINSGVAVEPLIADITPENAEELLSGADMILDGTDNFETRYLINDFAVSFHVPWIYGAAVGSYGLCMAVLPNRSACLKCVYPEPPSGPQPTCETAGVLGSITAVIASLQVAEALRFLSTGETTGKLSTVDVWTGEMRQVRQPELDPSCPACGRREFPHLNGPRRVPISLCGRNAVQIHEHARTLPLAELAERLAGAGSVRFNEFALRFETPPYLLTVFPDGRVIVKGTTDTGIARSLYAKYIGA
ncbi:MAG: ThiF family adenylyltransferase [Bryobacteraceae bacterium]